MVCIVMLILSKSVYGRSLLRIRRAHRVYACSAISHRDEMQLAMGLHSAVRRDGRMS